MSQWSEVIAESLEPVGAFERRLGGVRGARPGPMLAVVVGIHGNEPAGVLAVRRVLSQLQPRAAHLRGDLASLVGNCAALRRGVRYVGRDLNRQWTRERLDTLGKTPNLLAAEDREQWELEQELVRIRQEARGTAILLDLHTTSAGGSPFAFPGSRPECRDFALHFPITLVVGLQEKIPGLMVNHANEEGWVSLALEGGQHQSADSVDRLESALWLAMEAAGMLGRGDIPEWEGHRTCLVEALGGLPRVMEVFHRHEVHPGRGFRMEPGFPNLARVRGGTLLAHEATREIHAPHDGVMLMPLYQAQGDDGFFFGRELGLWRLRASAALRGHFPWSPPASPIPLRR